jgi:hypothetical protein
MQLRGSLKGNNMISLDGEYRIVLFVICSLLAVSLILASYCYMHSRKKAWHGYLWKGFSLMSLGCMLILLGLTLNIPKPFNVLRQIVILPVGIYGFSLIMVGEKKRDILTIRKDALTEKIARKLSHRPEEERSRLYS